MGIFPIIIMMQVREYRIFISHKLIMIKILRPCYQVIIIDAIFIFYAVKGEEAFHCHINETPSVCHKRTRVITVYLYSFRDYHSKFFIGHFIYIRIEITFIQIVSKIFLLMLGESLNVDIQCLMFQQCQDKLKLHHLLLQECLVMKCPRLFAKSFGIVR